MTAALLLSTLTLLLPLKDTLLTEVTVTALKEPIPARQIAAPLTRLNSPELATQGIYRHNALSSRIPALHIPDYGASLTSTVYFRGLGSRMENPVIGLYIDGIPVLDKNAYDFDWVGVRSATMLHGPQGTLYGRNTMGGVLSLSTLSPSSGEGPSLYAEYGTANTCRLGASFITGNHAFSVGMRHTDGYFGNDFKGRPCDSYDGLSLRWKWEKSPGSDTQITHVMSASISREGGFAYGLYQEGRQYPVAYNDEGSYRRLSVIEGMIVHRRTESAQADLSGSLQLLNDDMHMDQDFTPASVFTLRQQQLSGAATLELNLRRTDRQASWQPLTGFFAFYRLNSLSAPVLFKRDGIESLILDNANSHIPGDIGYLTISDQEMPVTSDFLLGSWNVALFHESVFHFGTWHLTAGLRLDYEGGRMDYDCLSTLHYRFIPTMTADKPFSVTYRGNTVHSGLVALPKLTVMYDVSDRTGLYTNISKGYRAGGFNTQIFSDILQTMMMNGLMRDLGVYLDRPFSSVTASSTEYAPESAWNAEAGLRYRDTHVGLEASVYYMAVRNQQLTVFPAGQSTGRMMTNAGRSRSLGTEIQMRWRTDSFHSRLSWSYCDARFVRYNDGNADYAGKHVPYIPSHTLFLGAGYRLPLEGCSLTADAGLRANGPLWWNESNTLSEPMRLFLDGRLALVFLRWEMYLRGENLTDTQARSFYFRSVGKDFFASCKPRMMTLGISVKL